LGFTLQGVGLLFIGMLCGALLIKSINATTKLV
jgi:hypothetical protein